MILLKFHINSKIVMLLFVNISNISFAVLCFFYKGTHQVPVPEIRDGVLFYLMLMLSFSSFSG